MKLCENTDPSIRAVQQFEERVVEKGQTSVMKEAYKLRGGTGHELVFRVP